jgi:hypothetical protein
MRHLLRDLGRPIDRPRVRMGQDVVVAPFNQDDERERAMISALNLEQRPDRARHEEDGHLDFAYGGHTRRLLFECKSAPVDSDFGTGRDTGLAQLQRWATMHFVFAWFQPRDNRPKRIWYGSPAMMRDWNLAEQAYLKPDLALLSLVPDAVDDRVVSAVLGDKEEYTFQDLNMLLKNQWNADKKKGRPHNLYKVNADIRSAKRTEDNLYSRRVAELAVRDRIRYLLARGGTVNNRKIFASYVMNHCVEIHPPRWAVNLAGAIEEALQQEEQLPHQ